MDAEHRDGRAAHTHALVAVKELRVAKSRLADRLAPTDRAALVAAMLHDTLEVLAAAGFGTEPGSGVTVVSPDPVVAAIAAAHGARHVPDPRPATAGESGLNAALTAAARVALSGSDVTDLVALQADLPLLRASELRDALAEARRVGRAIILDHTGSGTAALFACGRPRRLDPRFGAGSAARHIASGAVPLDGHWPGLRQDVDTAADLAAVADLGPGPHTRAVLDGLGCTPDVEYSPQP